MGEIEFSPWAKPRFECVTKDDERIAVLTKCCALDRLSFGDEGVVFKHLKRYMADGY